MKNSVFISVLLVLLVIDQASKLWFHFNFEFLQSVNVLPGFNFTLAYNEGAAFSFLAGQSGWQRWFFLGLALAISIILWQLRRDYPTQKVANWAILLVISGAIGNAIDRVWLGKVIDFLHVYSFWTDPVKHFPIFNGADIAISIGAALFVIQILFLDKKTAQTDQQ